MRFDAAHTTRCGALAVLLGLVFALEACSSPIQQPVEQPVREPEASVLFGDDRIADVLRNDFRKLPNTLKSFETLFGIGRGCGRSDSKEIFVIEERSSRFGGVQKPLPNLAPRLAISGCGPDAAGELLVAVVSSQESPTYASGDTLMTGAVEAMALDRRTGLYSFYIVGDEGGLTRIVRGADSIVRQHSKKVGQPMVTKALDGARCFHCHVHGDPVMNELADPWSGWVSARQGALASRNVTGETAELVAEATGSPAAPARTSYAGAFEVIVRKSFDTFAPAYTKATLGGTVAGGIGTLLRSVFCETELQYVADNGDTIPIELVIDPGVFDGARFDRPRADPAVQGPRYVPVRSELDKAIERALVTLGYLTPELTLAVRLLDPERDIFSPARCGVATGLPELPRETTPSAVRSAVRTTLATATQSLEAGPRRALLDALLDESLAPSGRVAVKEAWLTEARRMLAEATAHLGTPSGRAAAEDRTRQRQEAARRLFPRDENPLPVFDLPPRP